VDRQTDRHTYTLIAILHTSSGDEETSAFGSWRRCQVLLSRVTYGIFLL